jgi:hypothetical protein
MLKKSTGGYTDIGLEKIKKKNSFLNVFTKKFLFALNGEKSIKLSMCQLMSNEKDFRSGISV